MKSSLQQRLMVGLLNMSCHPQNCFQLVQMLRVQWMVMDDEDNGYEMKAMMRMMMVPLTLAETEQRRKIKSLERERERERIKRLVSEQQDGIFFWFLVSLVLSHQDLS